MTMRGGGKADRTAGTGNIAGPRAIEFEAGRPITPGFGEGPTMTHLLTFAQRSLLTLGDDIASLFHMPAVNESAPPPARRHGLVLPSHKVCWTQRHSFEARTPRYPANDNWALDRWRDPARRPAGRRPDLRRHIRPVPSVAGEAAFRDRRRPGGAALGCILVEDPVRAPAAATDLPRGDAI
jgi:hypothetical protein